MRILPVSILVSGFFWTACKSENEVYLQRRELRTNQYTYDAGITAVGDRQTFLSFFSRLDSVRSPSTIFNRVIQIVLWS